MFYSRDSKCIGTGGTKSYLEGRVDDNLRRKHKGLIYGKRDLLKRSQGDRKKGDNINILPS